MTEFYKWAADDFFSFLSVTGVLVLAAVILIESWKEKKS